MALYKKDMLVGGTIVGMVIALMLGILALSPKHETESKYIECVNKIAYEAFVEDDVGNTFDSGFDAGLLAGELCK